MNACQWYSYIVYRGHINKKLNQSINSSFQDHSIVSHPISWSGKHTVPSWGSTGRASQWCGSGYYPDPPSGPAFYSGGVCPDESSSDVLTSAETSDQDKIGHIDGNIGQETHNYILLMFRFTIWIQDFCIFFIPMKHRDSPKHNSRKWKKRIISKRM